MSYHISLNTYPHTHIYAHTTPTHISTYTHTHTHPPTCRKDHQYHFQTHLLKWSPALITKGRRLTFPSRRGKSSLCLMTRNNTGGRHEMLMGKRHMRLVSLPDPIYAAAGGNSDCIIMRSTSGGMQLRKL